MKDRILIVAGVTGIGAEAARLAAGEGARIVMAASDEVTGLELAAETGSEIWLGDLAAPGAAESVLAQCLSRFGRVDALFNATGLSGRRHGDGPVDECTDEGWDLILRNNLTVTFRFCRAVAGRMLQQQPGEDGLRGSILNTASALASVPDPRHFATHAYAAAKGGIAALTRAMAAYYAQHGIRVNALAPGVVRTPASVAGAPPELAAFLEKKQPLSGGMVEAGDAARAALFLLGGGARPITGAVLDVDGGWSVSGA
jgi:NAD(P)-dependent dehydrogenase (short-subunit alcohol dehydrogenase family)